MVPPALDLVHANVYCFSDDDKQRLLSNLSCCPGGLSMVQDNMSALWPHLFGPEYDNLRSLRTAAANGDTETVAAMIARGVSMDLPFPDDNNEISPLAAAVIEFMQDRIGRETIDQLLAAGANPLTALDNRKFGDIFDAKEAEMWNGTLAGVAGAVLGSVSSAAGWSRWPRTQRPPNVASYLGECLVAALAVLAVLAVLGGLGSVSLRGWAHRRGPSNSHHFTQFRRRTASSSP